MVGILLEDLDLAVSDGHIALGDNRMDVIENIIDRKTTFLSLPNKPQIIAPPVPTGCDFCFFRLCD